MGDSSTAAGIAGINEGTVKNSYNEGDILSQDVASGIVGKFSDITSHNINQNQLTNSYNTGDVTGDDVINREDLEAILDSSNYNMSTNGGTVNPDFDLNNDDIINFADLAIVRNSNNFNKLKSDNVLQIS